MSAWLWTLWTPILKSSLRYEFIQRVKVFFRKERFKLLLGQQYYFDACQHQILHLTNTAGFGVLTLKLDTSSRFKTQ